MNRRTFLQLSTTGAAVAVLAPSALLTTGCTFSLKGAAQTALNLVTQIYNADPTASWAPDLKIAIADMTVAIADWNGSSVNCELQSAAQIAATIMDSIPLGAPIDLIVTIALSAVNALLADLVPCSTAKLQKRLSREYSGHFHSTTAAYQMYYLRYHGAAEWHVGSDMKGDFNKAAKAAGLSTSVVK
jgi:hypothetical protein